MGSLSPTEAAYRPVGTRAWSSSTQLEVTLGLSKEAIMIFEFPLNQSRIRHWKPAELEESRLPDSW